MVYPPNLKATASTSTRQSDAVVSCAKHANAIIEVVMKPEVKVYYVDENVDISDIEQKLLDGWGVMNTTNQKLFILTKQPNRKIQTPTTKGK